MPVDTSPSNHDSSDIPSFAQSTEASRSKRTIIKPARVFGDTNIDAGAIPGQTTTSATRAPPPLPLFADVAAEFPKTLPPVLPDSETNEEIEGMLSHRIDFVFG
jgi:hypothetical protein